MSSSAKIVFFVLGSLALMIVLAAGNANVDSRHPADRIADSCKREFGYSQHHVTAAEFDCTVKLLNRWAAERERDKLTRAYRAAN